MKQVHEALRYFLSQTPYLKVVNEVSSVVIFLKYEYCSSRISFDGFCRFRVILPVDPLYHTGTLFIIAHPDTVVDGLVLKDEDNEKTTYHADWNRQKINDSPVLIFKVAFLVIAIWQEITHKESHHKADANDCIVSHGKFINVFLWYVIRQKLSKYYIILTSCDSKYDSANDKRAHPGLKHEDQSSEYGDK